MTTLCSCNCRKDCTLIAVIVSVILGIAAAFLQIAGVFTAAPVFLWVALGIAVVYLAVLLVATALSGRTGRGDCRCRSLSAVLYGILGTVLLAAVLLAVGVVATSVLSAILVGLLVAALSLTLIGTACLIRCLADCD